MNTQRLPLTVKIPNGFPAKTEFMPHKDKPMLTVSPNKYVGFSEDGSLFHRGFIGRKPGGHPLFYKDIVDVVLSACMLTKYSNEDNTAILTHTKSILRSIMEDKVAFDYVLPDTHHSVMSTSDIRPVTEYFINDLCVGMNQFFAIVDDHIVPTWCLNENHSVPITLSGYCVKQLDVVRYLTVAKDKFSRIASAFDFHPSCSKLCQEGFKIVKEYIIKTLPKERSSYPGGVDTTHNIRKQTQIQ